MKNKEKTRTEFQPILLEIYKNPRVVVRCKPIEDRIRKMNPVALCAN